MGSPIVISTAHKGHNCCDVLLIVEGAGSLGYSLPASRAKQACSLGSLPRLSFRLSFDKPCCLKHLLTQTQA